MTANTPEDYSLKMAVLDDVFTIVDMEKMYFFYIKLKNHLCANINIKKNCLNINF